MEVDEIEPSLYGESRNTLDVPHMLSGQHVEDNEVPDWHGTPANNAGDRNTAPGTPNPTASRNADPFSRSNAMDTDDDQVADSGPDSPLAGSSYVALLIHHCPRRFSFIAKHDR